MELGFGNGRGCRSVNLRGRRHRRRHEWFERMRQIVENAADREAEPIASSRPNYERQMA